MIFDSSSDSEDEFHVDGYEMNPVSNLLMLTTLNELRIRTV